MHDDASRFYSEAKMAIVNLRKEIHAKNSGLGADSAIEAKLKILEGSIVSAGDNNAGCKCWFSTKAHFGIYTIQMERLSFTNQNLLNRSWLPGVGYRF